MKVLLSIKPEYAFKIFEGLKKFEFRKTIFKNPNIKTVVVYASSPVQKVIGEFEIDSILSSSPKMLWEETQKKLGDRRKTGALIGLQGNLEAGIKLIITYE